MISLPQLTSNFTIKSNTLACFHLTILLFFFQFQFADHVTSLLEERDPDHPMFLYLPFQSVHAPLQVPQQYADLYKYKKDRQRRNYLG